MQIRKARPAITVWCQSRWHLIALGLAGTGIQTLAIGTIAAGWCG
jgi:hypothetical protein